MFLACEEGPALGLTLFLLLCSPAESRTLQGMEL